jgi:hypothetical protein
MSRLGPLLALALGFLMAGCTTSERTGVTAREASWPDEDALSGGNWLFAVEQDGDAKAMLAVSDVVALRDGTLVRMTALTLVGEWGMSLGMHHLDESERIGGGSGSKSVYASPRPGLTWGEVDDDEDVVIEIRIGSG